ncbi:hypothetical protein MBLNU230_g6423t1 [Neophaeotheca triangularis]
MSTAVATPTPALPSGVDRVSPHHSFTSMGPAPPSNSVNSSNSHNNTITSAPASVEPASKRARSNGSPTTGGAQRQPGSADKGATSGAGTGTGSGKTSPTSHRAGPPQPVKVKREPGSSPSMPTSRPRPKRLDLSSTLSNSRGPQTARPSGPLTSRESAGLAIQDVGLACLSPGFATHDPAMREQLQRSLDVRDQQRMIIEARQKGGKPGSSDETPQTAQDTTLFGVQTRTPATSRRKGPPPGLSIAAPSAEQFAHDRVIQSAPLHQTFTGLHPGDSQHPYSRHAQHGPSGLSQTSHIHHIPATQTNNRLPPIADVFANDRLDAPRTGDNYSPNQRSNPAPPPVPSPSFPPPSQHQTQPSSNAPPNSRQREFRSAEEAVQGLSGGRDELLPKVVHYGGVQPPTPPSPLPPQHPYHQQQNAQHQNPQPQHASYATREQPNTAGPRTTFNLPDHPPPTAPATAGASAYGPAGARPIDTFARTASTNGPRRRNRDEFERDNGSPPENQHSYPEAKRTAGPSSFGRGFGRSGGEEGGAASFGNGYGHGYGAGAGGYGGYGEEEEEEQRRERAWRQGMSAERKREEFLRLCERAWDLLHS